MGRTELHEWYRQFQKLKAQSPDAILLYRLGDFYEAFDDDAKLIAEVLEVTLTRKDYAVEKNPKPKGDQKLYCPMAGIPYHAIESYVARLVGMGYRVAIAEQVSETASSKSDTRPKSVFAAGLEQSVRQRGIAHREIVRIVTPGTVIEPAMLSAGKNNYLAAALAEAGHIGLAYIDLTTGEFAATEFIGERAAAQLEGELVRLQVSEVLVPDDETMRPLALVPSSARLTSDLAPMTKDEREGLLPHERVARRLDQESTARWTQGHVTAFQGWRWELATAREALLRQLGTQSLAGFGLEQRPLATRAAGAVLQYVQDTQRNTLGQIKSVRFYTTGAFMFLDPQTRRNLEILESSVTGKPKGALVGVLDNTRTPMGTRLLKRWLSQPLLDLAALQQRQEAVALGVADGVMRAELREALGSVGDMERAVNRMMQGTTTMPRDMVQLRQALRALPGVARALGKHRLLLQPDAMEPGAGSGGQGTTSGRQEAQVGGSAPTPRRGAVARVAGDDLFADLEPSTENQEPGSENQEPRAESRELGGFDVCSEALALLEQAIDDDPPALLGGSNYLRSEEGGEKPRRVIRPGFDARMDEVIAASRDAQSWIANLEGRERERTGIKALKVGFNQVFGYFIEIPRAQSSQVPPNYERKQTLVNAERFITSQLKDYERIVLNAQQRLADLEREVFARVCAELAQYGDRLRGVAQTVARLDVVAALAEAAVRGRYTRPQLTEDTTLRITAGRHPVVERMLNEVFVPNDACVDTGEQQLLIITGPNMAGKCLAGDSLIFTTEGLVRLAELMPAGAREGAFTELTCRVRSLQGERPATHFYRGGKQATRKLTTRLGYSLEGTPDHRLWVRHPDGTEGWKRMGEISVGDVVAIKRQIDLWGTTTEIDFCPEQMPYQVRKHRLPTHLDEDLAYGIGLLIGDGTLTYETSLLLSTADACIADEFGRIMERVFGYTVGAKSNGKDYAVCSRLIRSFLEHLDVGYGQAHEKYVPRSILRAPKAIVVAFLQGLFDSDGYANNRYGGIELVTASPRLAREVQLLLLNLGIIASLRVKPTSAKLCHRLCIYGADAIAFHKQVGFRLPRKQLGQELASTRRMPNVGGIPYLAGTLKQVQARIVATPNKPVALSNDKCINSIFYMYIPTGRNISYTKLDQLVDYCAENNVSCPELETLQTRRYFYERVVSIEPGEGEVYDLSVAEEHAYIANGLVSHNSTVLRQVALIVLLAQIGSFVPAEAAEVGLVDRIFTRIGAQDDIATGQSTFMVEMTETAALLSQSTRRSLIILDEVGRGTSTYDGMAIARAVVEYIHNDPRLQCRTLFATHYHELTALEELLPRVRNYHMAAVEKDGKVVFLYELRRGGADRSYGIHVAELAGIPRLVIRRATELLEELERREPRSRKQEPGTENQEPRTENQEPRTQFVPSTPCIQQLLAGRNPGQWDQEWCW